MHAAMKSLAVGFVFSLVVPWALLADEGPAATLSANERAQLIDMLERSRGEFETLVAQATGDAWTATPDPDRWSVGEVAEHLAASEDLLFGVVMGAMTQPEDPEWEAVAASGVDGLMSTIQDRTQRFEAPEPLEPTGEASREAILTRYAAGRIKTLDFVRTTLAPIKRHTADGRVGTMNVHQWLALMASHNLRHNQQMKEVLGQIETP